MRAFILETPKPVENYPLGLTEMEIPKPKADEVLVEISAYGICCTDLHVCEGELAPHLEKVIRGHQIVGRVVGKGKDVTGTLSLPRKEEKIFAKMLLSKIFC